MLGQTDKGALVLLSGGLDSSTLLMLARQKESEIHALSFRYGQRHTIELEFAKEQAALAHVASHKIISLDPDIFSGSSLVGTNHTIPLDRIINDEIPSTYIPARNILFLSYAVALSESLGVRAIYIGINALDYSGYPDCRPEFIEAFRKMILVGTKRGVEKKEFRIEAPLLNLTKAEIIRLGTSLGVDYAKTCTCYQPAEDGTPCGHCDSCILRAKGFSEAALSDPLYK